MRCTDPELGAQGHHSFLAIVRFPPNPQIPAWWTGLRGKLVGVVGVVGVVSVVGVKPPVVAYGWLGVAESAFAITCHAACGPECWSVSVEMLHSRSGHFHQLIVTYCCPPAFAKRLYGQDTTGNHAVSSIS